MDRGIEPRVGAPLIHGRMIYRCECCGKSWPMYLEKGIEEFGANHKPSPFTITCPYCGGLAMDVSGIQKVPGGGYVPLPDGYSYFANAGNRDCGVPTFPEPKAEKLEGKEIDISIADEIDKILREKEEAYIAARVAGCAGIEAEEIEKYSERLAEGGYSAEDAARALCNAIQALMNDLTDWEEPDKGKPLDFVTAWDRKEAREKLRAIEREAACRFRQHKARESAWTARKRTGQRKREWRGPWRDAKRTN